VSDDPRKGPKLPWADDVAYALAPFHKVPIKLAPSPEDAVKDLPL
jgi:hypothetical protein